jgi:hypothetical protein
MGKLFSIILTGIIVSFYFFPFEFSFLPGYNTKMIMAVLGLAWWGVSLAKRRTFKADSSLFTLSVVALVVSLVGVTSVIFNNTRDYTYASYIMSMWVWLGGAYFVVEVIRYVHKKMSVEIVCHYLIGVCVAQCGIAILIDNVPVVKAFTHRMISSGFLNAADLEEKDRLYGIGCALDVAGTRFAAVLTMIAALIAKHKGTNLYRLYTYMASFVVIVVIGNVIARTTTVGVVLALVYWIIIAYPFNFLIKRSSIGILKHVLILSAVALPIIISLYNNNPAVREDIRFAFEGFFSLAEKGEWDVSSNDRLMTMYVFPDNAKTWIIGDGYFDGPTNTDPYYVGPPMTGFYMWTDVGYLRFIFYFGLIGLAAFMFFFIKCGQVCAHKFRNYALLFWLLMLLNFIIWFKVSTDIFVVLAIFLCISKEDNDNYLTT